VSSRGAPRPRGAAGRRDRRSSLFLHSFLPSCPPTSEYANADDIMHHRIDHVWRCVLCTAFGSPNSMIVVRRRGGTLPVVLRRPVR
jgi:hypothetical protein